MSAELVPGEENEDSPQSAGRTLTERQRYFAMRIALGDSVRKAADAIGVTDRHGRRLVHEPAIEEAIRQYAAEAVDSARRVIVGKVRWAARRMIALGQPGGSSHRGAAVEFAALKYILDVNRVSDIQVGTAQARILSYVPREGREDLPADVQDTLAVIEAQYREEALPLSPTKDGLPPDFPRADGEAAGGYAQSQPTTPPELSDPQYFRRSLMRD